MLFSPAEIVETLTSLGVTHVVWLPDSEIGHWESAIEASPELALVRVCREGEAWVIAAGLWLGGKRPIVIIQSTGLFESGDALRSVVYDLKIPVFGIIGHRNYLVRDSNDSAKRFADGILDAWLIPYELIGSPEDKPRLAEHFRKCNASGKAAAVLLGEGKP